MVEGSFEPSATSYRLQILGLPFEAASLKIDGSETTFSELPNKVLVVEVPLDFEEVEVLF